jgi:hypothetical protein
MTGVNKHPNCGRSNEAATTSDQYSHCRLPAAIIFVGSGWSAFRVVPVKNATVVKSVHLSVVEFLSGALYTREQKEALLRVSAVL